MRSAIGGRSLRSRGFCTLPVLTHLHPAAVLLLPPRDGKRCSARASSTEAATGNVKVVFRAKQHTEFGEVLKVVGSTPELGSWNPDAAPALTWGEGDIWTGAVHVPASSKLEFKVVVYKQSSKRAVWEPQPNNKVLQVPEYAGEVEVACTWGTAEVKPTVSKAGSPSATRGSRSPSPSAMKAALQDGRVVYTARPGEGPGGGAEGGNGAGHRSGSSARAAALKAAKALLEARIKGNSLGSLDGEDELGSDTLRSSAASRDSTNGTHSAVSNYVAGAVTADAAHSVEVQAERARLLAELHTLRQEMAEKERAAMEEGAADPEAMEVFKQVKQDVARLASKLDKVGGPAPEAMQDARATTQQALRTRSPSPMPEARARSSSPAAASTAGAPSANGAAARRGSPSSTYADKAKQIPWRAMLTSDTKEGRNGEDRADPSLRTLMSRVGPHERDSYEASRTSSMDSSVDEEDRVRTPTRQKASQPAAGASTSAAARPTGRAQSTQPEVKTTTERPAPSQLPQAPRKEQGSNNTAAVAVISALAAGGLALAYSYLQVNGVIKGPALPLVDNLTTTLQQQATSTTRAAGAAAQEASKALPKLPDTEEVMDSIASQARNSVQALADTSSSISEAFQESGVEATQDAWEAAMDKAGSFTQQAMEAVGGSPADAADEADELADGARDSLETVATRVDAAAESSAAEQSATFVADSRELEDVTEQVAQLQQQPQQQLEEVAAAPVDAHVTAWELEAPLQAETDSTPAIDSEGPRVMEVDNPAAAAAAPAVMDAADAASMEFADSTGGAELLQVTNSSSAAADDLWVPEPAVQPAVEEHEILFPEPRVCQQDMLEEVAIMPEVSIAHDQAVDVYGSDALEALDMVEGLVETVPTSALPLQGLVDSNVAYTEAAPLTSQPISATAQNAVQVVKSLAKRYMVSAMLPGTPQL